jgi:hypothetical protein
MNLRPNSSRKAPARLSPIFKTRKPSKRVRVDRPLPVFVEPLPTWDRQIARSFATPYTISDDGRQAGKLDTGQYTGMWVLPSAECLTGNRKFRFTVKFSHCGYVSAALISEAQRDGVGQLDFGTDFNNYPMMHDLLVSNCGELKFNIDMRRRRCTVISGKETITKTGLPKRIYLACSIKNGATATIVPFDE